MNKPDIKVMNCGSVWQFMLVSQAAKGWVKNNVEIPAYIKHGEGTFSAEARYGADLVTEMKTDGLIVVPF